MSLNLGNLVLNGKCHIMGILNVTPDSFYDGGKHFDLVDTQKRIGTMIEEGVEIIDIGGESTRPGSKPVTIDEELDRVIPAIEYISENYEIPISTDFCSPLKLAVTCLTLLFFFLRYSFTLFNISIFELSVFSSIGFIFS